MDDQQGTKSCLFSVMKLVMMLVIALVVVLGAFFAGITFQKRQTPFISAGAPALVSPPISLTDLVSDEDVDEFTVFWEAWTLVQEGFYGDIPEQQERVYGAIRGMVNTYGDQNTAFIDPSRAVLLQEDASGSFEGIGATVQVDEMGRLLIAEPYAGRPAAEAGVLRGDIVLEVDGIAIRDYSLYEAVNLIRGPAGSIVTLTIQREGEAEPIDIDVARAKIEIEVVESEMLTDEIGYVSLSEFSSGASEKLYRAIADLEAQGAEQLVLDLRSNPGGFLSEAVLVSSLFFDEGVVVREQRKGIDEEQVYEVRPGIPTVNLPMVVLINRGSASASEIVAGAIKDYDRGPLIGEQTFGKGTVQMPHTLSDGSELRVTIAQWFTPNGDLIHQEGIVPDVVIELTQEDFMDGLDPQLDRAIEYLQENRP